MYTIKADDKLIYYPLSPSLQITRGEIVLETDKSGSATFAILPNHPNYDDFVKLKTAIRIYRDTDLIFKGRVINDSAAFNKTKTVVCEGEKGYLNDTLCPDYTATTTRENLFKYVVTEHNKQVAASDPEKVFAIGTVDNPDDEVTVDIYDYPTSLSVLDNLISEYGGHLIIETLDNGESNSVLHWRTEFTDFAPQTIEFGKNLLDFVKKTSAVNLATGVLPLGINLENDDGTTERLTVESVNDGSKVVFNEGLKAKYGAIIKKVDFGNVDDATALKGMAELYLQSLSETLTLELSAIDLAVLDKSIQSFKCGQLIFVKSTPHNFSDSLVCSKQTINLLKPENDKVVLGYKTPTVTAKANETVRTVKRNASRSSGSGGASQVAVDMLAKRVTMLEKLHTAFATASVHISNVISPTNQTLTGATGSLWDFSGVSAVRFNYTWDFYTDGYDGSATIGSVALRILPTDGPEIFSSPIAIGNIMYGSPEGTGLTQKGYSATQIDISSFAENYPEADLSNCYVEAKIMLKNPDGDSFTYYTNFDITAVTPLL